MKSSDLRILRASSFGVVPTGGPPPLPSFRSPLSLSLSPPRELLDLRLIALRAFLVFLFLLGFLHVEVNGEAYELKVLFRQIPLSEFLQELGLVLLQAPNHFRSSVDPTMDNVSVFCAK